MIYRRSSDLEVNDLPNTSSCQGGWYTSSGSDGMERGHCNDLCCSNISKLPFCVVVFGEGVVFGEDGVTLALAKQQNP